MLGRLNPTTGELKEIETEPRPYGIKAAEDGTLWIAYNGTNKDRRHASRYYGSKVILKYRMREAECAGSI